jgi:hypothetical protein
MIRSLSETPKASSDYRIFRPACAAPVPKTMALIGGFL